MFWADEIAEKIIAEGGHKPYWVDDMKTPSGVIHVGSLRGVMVHDLVYKALIKKGHEAKFTYIYNDIDPMDGLPVYLDHGKFDRHMGEPLYKIPAPDGKSANFARQFGDQFTASMHKIGAYPEILWSSELYSKGVFNDVIREALDKAAVIRKIYKDVSGQNKPDNWYPFQVICPECGKVGSTLVYDWDGTEVSYRCEPSMVDWAHGCGHTGKISPFNGTGKLMWKVDWPAHWKALGITIEGAGKDHASAGGSRDVARLICKDVFGIPEPYDIPYEWFLIGGRKMSTSKGVGTAAHDFVEIMPGEIGRFLFVRNHFNKQINFDPSGDTISFLFDLYDQAAEAYWNKTDDKLATMFEYAQIGRVPEKYFLPRFSDVATYLQDSKVNIIKKFEEIKGSSLTDKEKEELDSRIKFAKIWIQKFAPESDVFEPNEKIPEEARNLSEHQKEYLKVVAQMLDGKWSPEDLQTALYEKTKEMDIDPKEAFTAIYLALIGKTHGPKAAWFLLEHKALAVERFKQLADLKNVEVPVAHDPNGYSISDELKAKFPGISFAYTVIKNVNITSTNEELEARKNKLSEAKSKLSYEDIRALSPISSYISMLKATKTDTGSHRPSPEALLRRLSQGKKLYTINTAVDAYNLAVLETGIGLGGFDYDNINEPVTLRFSSDGERMHLLGDDEPTTTREGQLVYSDAKKPLSLDLNYRDIDETKITAETKNIILFSDGGPGIEGKTVVDALEKGAKYIQEYCGGEIGKINLVS